MGTVIRAAFAFFVAFYVLYPRETTAWIRRVTLDFRIHRCERLLSPAMDQHRARQKASAACPAADTNPAGALFGKTAGQAAR